MLFKLSNLNSNLALTLGYLKPALNNSAQVIREPNSIFTQNNSWFKNKLKTCLPPSMLSSSSIVHVNRQVQDKKGRSQVVQLRKYSSNSRCRPLSRVLAVLTMLLAKFCLFLPGETSETFRHVYSHYTKTTQPRPQVFSVNGSIIGNFAELLTSSVQYGKILSNLVNSSWL